jgi:hypothetical protein
MLFVRQQKRSLWVMLTLIATVFMLLQCMNGEENKKETTKHVGFSDFAGSAKCASCHREIFESHLATAHYITAKPAAKEWIKGRFEKGKNTYRYSPSILLAMEERDSGLYQVVYFKGQEKKAMRFDVTVGSGVKGQSFLTWRQHRLFQLPITYFTAADIWSNSPGFPPQKVMIDKPVTARCLECHVSYAEAISGPLLDPMEFDRNKIIYGVDCEKCHGAGLQHVNYHTQNPGDTVAKYIINTAQLSRELQLDICALCHAGPIEKTKPSFEYTAGNKLSDYFVINPLNEAAVNNGNIDVHGNQYGLLKASKCFRMSTGMTCSTCHNPHRNEKGQAALFSQRCMGCHNVEKESFKSESHSPMLLVQNNCIDCHMPALPSRAITVQLEGEETPRVSLIRSHFIGIYPEETTKFRVGQTQQKK